MKLSDYVKALPGEDARKGFAVRCGTTPGHMRNVMYGSKTCGVTLAVAIERETGNAVTRRELCPDKWAEVWPDLASA